MQNSARWLAALWLAAVAWLAPAPESRAVANSEACCITLPPIPQNEADGFLRSTFGVPSGTGVAPEFSYFTIDIQPGGPGVPTPPIPPGRYAAWCFDPLTRISPGVGTTYGGYLHSTCDPNLNQYLPNHPGIHTIAPESWKKVNYLINHRLESCNGTVPTMWEVQVAIWISLGLTPATSTLPSRPEVIQCLVEKAANGAASGGPQCGEKMAVAWNIDINWDNIAPEVQLIFLEVPCPCTALGDFVWLDENANGIQDEPASSGVNGIPVHLLDCDGNPVLGTDGQPRTTVTADKAPGLPGYYLFRNLAAGCYRVAFELPSGSNLAFTRQNAPGSGTADGSDPDPLTGVTGNINLSYGAQDLNWDAGLVQLAEIGDFVWEDLDRDGQQQGNEPGIPGVDVFLNGVDVFGNAVSDSRVTGPLGEYLFADLFPGTYTVTFGTLPGYVRTIAGSGADATDSDADPLTGETGPYTLLSGDSNLTVDAGLFRPASLGDFVFDDKDANGQQGGTEPGIAGAI
ncbi:MAG: hypothetical protein JNL97_13410, partial [Verrucomicrobiales bacterium]|nr:hypothetical protein [Verrucomicrobiales bacterium]